MNAIRSPMAQFLAKEIFPNNYYFRSAGVNAGDLDTFMIAVMKERGISLESHIARSLDDLEDRFCDLIITLAPEAHHGALEFFRDQAVEVEYWPTIDPSTIAGNREQILEMYRKVRDILEEKIKLRFARSD